MRVVLIGGGALAAGVAGRLLTSGVEVVGVGRTPPAGWPEEARFESRSDPSVGEDVASLDADVVVCSTTGAGDDGEAAVRALVRAIGGALECRRLVYWGSHRVYAAAEETPLVPLREDALLVDRGPFAVWADLDREVGALVGDRRLEVYRFRAAPVAGRESSGRSLSLIECRPVVHPSRELPFQLTHVDDAVEVLVRACTGGHAGTYNVASDGLLLRSRAARALGRLAIPLPRWAAALALGPGRLTGHPRSLRRALAESYDPVVIDNGRLKTHFGYRPRHSCREALRLLRDPGAD